MTEKKTNTYIKASSIMLIVLSLLILVGCVDGGFGSYVNRVEQFNDCEELKAFIENHNGDECEFVTLNFGNDDSATIKSSKYTVRLMAKLTNNVKYMMNTAAIEGKFEIIKDGQNGKTIEIGCHYAYSNGREKLNENTAFTIESIEENQLDKVLSSKYTAPAGEYAYNYVLYADGNAIMHIVISGEEQENEEYLSELCNMILSNVKIIN